MKHTAEPWYLGCNGGERIQIVVCESNIRPDEPTGLVAEVNKRIQFTPGSDPMNSPTADANAQRIVQCVNALAGIPDPAAALKAAREALERCEKLISCLTVGQVMDAGWEAISASGLHEYCLNEGRAERSDRISTQFISAALVALKGEQP